MGKKEKSSSLYRKSLVALSLLALLGVLSGCEAKLDLDGVKQEQAKSVRRTDQFQALTDNGNVVTAVGFNGLILTNPRVSDPEASWKWKRTELVGRPNLIDIDSCPDSSMIALSVERQVWISANNGQDWTMSKLPTQESMLSLTCAPNGDYWAVGSFTTLLHSTDHGETWRENSLDEDAILTTIQFLDAQNGYVLGEFGTIAKTGDGGQSWQRAKKIPNEFYPQGSYFIDSRHGWVAGLSGVILYTPDGGETWERQEAPTKSPLYSIHGKGGRLFVVGDNYTVLELSGQGWVALDTPHLSTYLRNAEIVNDDLLLVAGGNGTLSAVEIKHEQSLAGGLSNAR